MFYLMAKWMNRKNQGFGALGASLFIILIINPFNIYEPGLQLSFFAVWGIIWLQRPILRWWTPGNLVLFKLWEMSAVSLSAQIMTIPVSLFYFGQFPNYFMLANMLVIPLTTICIYSCILQLLCTPFKEVMEVIAMINNFLIKVSDIFVLELKDWPGAVSHWQVTMSESILLYLLIFAIENWCRTRRFQLILWMMFLLILQTLLMLIQIA
jgi:competence protein ComEC